MAKGNDKLKKKIRALRTKGLSFTDLSRKFGVAKSTLHYWLADLPPSRFQRDPQFRLRHLARIRPLANRAIRAKKMVRVAAIKNKVQQEVDKISLNNPGVQKALAAMLYWAEGNKTSAFRFANTDPALALLFLTLLRDTFKIDEREIKVTLYLHHYHNVAKTRDFWSKLLDVPKSQFAKVYIKSRKNTKRKRKNFVGICFIGYRRGCEDMKRELLFLARAIQEKITKHTEHALIAQLG